MSVRDWWRRQAVDSWPRVITNTMQLRLKEPSDALREWGRKPRPSIVQIPGPGPLLCLLAPIGLGTVGVRCLLGLVEPAGFITSIVGLLAIGCSALGLYVDAVWLQRPVHRRDRTPGMGESPK